MLAFHNDEKVKQLYVSRIKAHRAMDEIVQGYYWQGGKGCLVGCAVHSDRHAAFEDEMDIPRHIAYLADRIFEGLSNVEAKELPLTFFEAIPVGADLSLVLPHFLVWLLEDPNAGVVRFASLRGKQVIATIAALYKRRIAGDEPSEQEWQSAAAATAHAYANIAPAVAADPEAAAYADAAAYAADAAAYAAAVADVVTYATEAATYAATYADVVTYAVTDVVADVARRAQYQKMRDKLLALLSEAPVRAK